MQIPSQKPKRSLLSKVLLGIGALTVACCGLSTISAVISPRAAAPTGIRALANVKGEASPTIAMPPTVAAPAQLQPTESLPTSTEPPLPTDTPLPTTDTPLIIAGVPAQSDIETLSRDTFGDKLIKAELNDVFGELVATVDYDLGAQWDEKSTVMSLTMDCKVFCPKVMGYDIGTLELRGYTTFVDKYGKESQEVAVKYTISKDLAQKLAWDNLTFRRLAAAIAIEGEGSGVYVHPALRKAWLEWLGE